MIHKASTHFELPWKTQMLVGHDIFFFKCDEDSIKGKDLVVENKPDSCLLE